MAEPKDRPRTITLVPAHLLLLSVYIAGLVKRPSAATVLVTVACSIGLGILAWAYGRRFAQRRKDSSPIFHERPDSSINRSDRQRIEDPVREERALSALRILFRFCCAVAIAGIVAQILGQISAPAVGKKWIGVAVSVLGVEVMMIGIALAAAMLLAMRVRRQAAVQAGPAWSPDLPNESP